MYYTGSPLVERNKITEAEIKDHNAFFKQTMGSYSFAERIFERYASEKITLVLYFGAKWDDERLVKHHRDKYSDTPYYVQELVSQRTIKTVIVNKGKITGYSVNHHDRDWLETIEHSYDDEFNLIEYREFIYEKGTEKIVGENIFYASNWLVSEEKYDQ